jgi:hypothetical protein
MSSSSTEVGLAVRAAIPWQRVSRVKYGLRVPNAGLLSRLTVLRGEAPIPFRNSPHNIPRRQVKGWGVIGTRNYHTIRAYLKQPEQRAHLATDAQLSYTQ